MEKLLVNGHYLSVGDFVKVRYETMEYTFEGFVTKLLNPGEAELNNAWFITERDVIVEHVPCSP